MIYVLDTNTWSDVFRGGKAGRKLAATPMVRVLLAAPVLYELRRGVVRSADVRALRQAIDDIAAAYEIAPFDAGAAEAAATLASSMSAKGRQIHHLDTLIAGIAIARGAVLVTRDRDFKGAANLKLETWA